MIDEGNGVFASYRVTTGVEVAQLISITLIFPKDNITFKDLNSSHPTLRGGIIEGSGN